jgi:hypothetical protein
MTNILNYMRRISPETAWWANSKSARNDIRKDAREYTQFLASARETAKQIDLTESAKQADEDMRFLLQWMTKFGVKDEE